MTRLLFWLLLATVACLLWRRWRVSGRSAARKMVAVGPAEMTPFGRWLQVLHGEGVDVAALDRAYARALHDCGDSGAPPHWPGDTAILPEDAVGFTVAEVVDPAYAFAVDWKDGETFADFAADMAAHCGFVLDWGDEDPQAALPETLMPLAYRQFLAHGAILYNAQTHADFYFLMQVPLERSVEFEAASAAWGLDIRTADRPY